MTMDAFPTSCDKRICYGSAESLFLLRTRRPVQTKSGALPETALTRTTDLRARKEADIGPIIGLLYPLGNNAGMPPRPGSLEGK